MLADRKSDRAVRDVVREQWKKHQYSGSRVKQGPGSRAAGCTCGEVSAETDKVEMHFAEELVRAGIALGREK